jgi:hypothetical protein
MNAAAPGVLRVVLLMAAFAAAIAYTATGNSYDVFIMATLGLTALVGVGLNVLLGLTGQVSFGHVGFYAIGAYAVAGPYGSLQIQFLAGAADCRAYRHGNRSAARAAGDAGTRPVPRDGDHRFRLRHREHRRRVARGDRRAERHHGRRQAGAARQRTRGRHRMYRAGRRLPPTAFISCAKAVGARPCAR